MIDIIIPTYNSNKTIARTLNSILDQTNINDITTYVVDDCSDDDYTEIINYFSKYMKVKLLKLNKNSGPGVARQYGLDNSFNEYVVFIDADDVFYDENSIANLYNSIKNYDISFGLMYQKTNGNEMISYHEGCLHGKMYRRSFINKHKIKFNSLRNHEDNAFNQLYLVCAKKINYIEQVIYKYNYNSNSLSNKIDAISNMELYIESMTWLFKEIGKRKNINEFNVEILVVTTMFNCYFNYLLNEQVFDFIFAKMTSIKRLYKKYIKKMPYSDILRIYNKKSLDYPVIPTITVDDFINKIK